MMLHIDYYIQAQFGYLNEVIEWQPKDCVLSVLTEPVTSLAVSELYYRPDKNKAFFFFFFLTKSITTVKEPWEQHAVQSSQASLAHARLKVLL